MPLGLQLKSLIVGFLLAYFVIPWLMSMLNRPRATSAA